MKKTRAYVPAPEVPQETKARMEVVLAVISGQLTVSEAARRLGLSRPRFQTVMHRALGAMIEELGPQAPGRPAKPAREVELETEREQFARENARLRDRIETMDRLLLVASDILRGREKLAGRMREPRGTKKETPDGEDPGESDARRRLAGWREMRRRGVHSPMAATAVGVSAPTARRWSARERACAALRRRRGPCGHRVVDVAVAARVEAIVRRSRGMFGADALRRNVGGVSRRQAAAIKRVTVTAMERERKAEAVRVVVTVPGVVRGFDQFQVGRRYALVSADGCVPFRTSAPVVNDYTGRAVADALEADWTAHGAPLVERLDRASVHRVPEVIDLAAAHGVLLLSGPPRYPRFYGQLERQNREHRAWLGDVAPDALDAACAEMIDVLNAEWPRRILGWRTARDAWLADRVTFTRAERLALRDEVADRTERIRRHVDVRGRPADLCERIAIEATLAKRGFLRRAKGGWC